MTLSWIVDNQTPIKISTLIILRGIIWIATSCRLLSFIVYSHSIVCFLLLECKTPWPNRTCWRKGLFSLNIPTYSTISRIHGRVMTGLLRQETRQPPWNKAAYMLAVLDVACLHTYTAMTLYLGVSINHDAPLETISQLRSFCLVRFL